MNDKFLTQFRKKPNKMFEDNLWRRLQQIKWETAVSPQPKPHKRPFRLAPTFAIVALLLLTAFSLPSVRAQIEDVLRQIGGIVYKETAVYPGAVDDEEITIIESETVNGTRESLVEDARRRLDLEFNLPSAIPERFILDDNVIYNEVSGTSAMFLWLDSEPESRGSFSLDLRRTSQDINWVVGLNHTKEVQINGQTAALISGGWNADTQKWEDDDANAIKVLRWEQNNIEYSLTMYGNTLSEEEFITIAESIE